MNNPHQSSLKITRSYLTLHISDTVGYEIEEHDNPADFFLDVILGNKESNIPEIEQENSRIDIQHADVAVIEAGKDTVDSNGEKVSGQFANPSAYLFDKHQC